MCTKLPRVILTKVIPLTLFEKWGVNTSDFPTCDVLIDEAEGGYSAVSYKGIFCIPCKTCFHGCYSKYFFNIRDYMTNLPENLVTGKSFPFLESQFSSN